MTDLLGGLAVRSPGLLILLLLAPLPLVLQPRKPSGFPALEGLPDDPVSTALDWAIRVAGVVALSALVLAAAGLQVGARTIERTGRGSHISLLIDRSGSMNDTFAGRTPEGGEESKSQAAKRLLDAFVARRPRDQIGIVGFSTAPMLVVPMTDRLDAVRAGIAAIDRPGLAFTDVGRGLAMALDQLEGDTGLASRSIVLVSDGAAVIDRKVQEALRNAFAKRPVNLYWLYLRSAGSPGIFAPPPPDKPDNPQVLPERHLNIFLGSLGQRYRAFEAENAEAVADAIAEIDKLEASEIRYRETLPNVDLAGVAYAVAVGALALIIAAKLLEVRIGNTDSHGRAA
jgi:mxaC protein